MTQVALITAIYDGYDVLKPVLPQAGVDVEWIVVTDTVPDAVAAAGWTVVHEPRPGEQLPPVDVGPVRLRERRDIRDPSEAAPAVLRGMPAEQR